MTRRAILHIGTEKTGTTTLQNAFVADSQRLTGLNVRYPLLGGGAAHTGLVFAAADRDEDVADLAVLAGVAPGETREAFAGRLGVMIADEVAAHSNAVFVFSTEHAHSRLVSAESIARLRNMLVPHFDAIEVVVYLRRWDRLALSYYATEVRNNGVFPFSFGRYAGSTLLDYQRMLHRFDEAFGSSALRIGIYDRAELHNGSIIDDFSDRLGLPPLSPIPDRNAGVSGGVIALLRAIERAGEHLPREAADGVRQAVIASRQSERGAPPVAREHARAFVDRHARQEQAIRARWLPGRSALFDARFDDYPVEVPPGGTTWREVSAALIDTVAMLRDQGRAVAGELSYHRARTHMLNGNTALARMEIIEALRNQPDTPGYHHVLAMVEHSAGRLVAARVAVEQAIALSPDDAGHHALRDMIG